VTPPEFVTNQTVAIVNLQVGGSASLISMAWLSFERLETGIVTTIGTARITADRLSRQSAACLCLSKREPLAPGHEMSSFTHTGGRSLYLTIYHMSRPVRVRPMSRRHAAARIDPHASINRCDLAQNCQFMPDNYLSKRPLDEATTLPWRRAKSASPLEIRVARQMQIPLGTTLA
jgi:hypothetical protein